MAKRPQSTEEILQQIVDEFKKIAEKAKAEGRQPSERAAGRAAQAQAELNKIKAEKEAALQITQAAKEIKKSTSETTKATRQNAAATKENQKRSAQQSKDTNRLTNVVQKLSGGVAGGTVKNIGGIVGGSIRQSTVGNMMNPKALAGSMLGALGLESIVPATMDGGSRRSQRQPRVSGAEQQKGETKEISIFSSIESTLKGILKATKDNNEILLDLAESWEKGARERIEAAREANKPQDIGTTGAGATSEASGGGGMLGGIKKLLDVSFELIGPIFKSLGPVLTSLIRFATRIALPIAALTAIIGSLEQQDWATMFGNISKVFDDILKGNWLDAIVRSVGTIGDVLVKGVGRLLANILEYFGFTGVAKTIRDFLDNFNLADKLVELVHAAIDFVVNAYNTAKETVKGWIDSSFKLGQDIIDWVVGVKDGIVNAYNVAKDTISGWLNSAFDLGQQVIDWSVSIKDSIVNKFTTAKDEIVQWWDNFSLSATLTEKFEEIKQKIIDFVGEENIKKALDVLNFDVGGYISEKLGEVVDSIKKMFTDLGKSVNNFLADKFSFMGSFNPFTKIEDTPKTAAPQSSFASMAAAGPATPLKADTTVTEVAPAYDETGFGQGSLQASTTYTPLVNTKNIAMASQSGWNAMASAGPPKVVVAGGGSGTMNASREPPSNPRNSGAVSTAPAPSLLDRTMNSRAFFGAGHP